MNPVGATHVQVAADDGFEELSTVQRRIKDLGQADFELPDGESMLIAGRAIVRGQRPGQTSYPAVEEALHIIWTESIADALEAGRIRAPAKPIVETFKGKAKTACLLFGPLVPVQAHAYRVREVGADFDERWPPLPILNVEVHLVDVDRLAREREAHTLLGNVFLAFEAGRLLLSDADEHHAFVGSAARALLCSEAILLLTAAEVDDRDRVLVSEALEVITEAVQQRSEQGWRSDGRVELLATEGVDVARCLEERHVAIEVQTIHAGDGQGHVVAEYGGNAGAGHDWRLPYGCDEHVDRAIPAPALVNPCRAQFEEGSSFTDHPHLPSTQPDEAAPEGAQRSGLAAEGTQSLTSRV